MFEVRFHGRGGQGSVTAAELLAIAAFMDGKYSQAFPIFGVERRGAPVQAFCRIDDVPIRLRSQVYNPDMVVVQDASLMSDLNVLEGIKKNGSVIVNTSKHPSELNINAYQIKTVDATQLALEIIGKPIVNTIMLGAVSRLGVVTLDSIIKSIKHKFNGKIRDLNIEAVKKAYHTVI
jgi:pyruvate ferredoxin oxidoreductase gamma subunit